MFPHMQSVTITLAYLMSTKGLCMNDAFNFVRARKPDISPNFHFMEQVSLMYICANIFLYENFHFCSFNASSVNSEVTRTES